MSLRPYSADLQDAHGYAPLAVGDALQVKAQVATALCNVSLAVANGNSFAATTTSGTTLLTVGPFANACVIQLGAKGLVRVETSVAGMSSAV